MTRMKTIGVALALCTPLAVQAGGSLEDIEGGDATITADTLSDDVPAQPELMASEPAAEEASDASDKAADAAEPITIVKSPSTFQFYSSDKAAELTYERSGSVFGLDNDRASLAFLMNEERDNAVTASIMFDASQTLVKGLRLSFGPQVIAGLLSIENSDVIGFAAGIEALYELPVKKFPLRISTALSYAPDILTFGQSDRIIDWNVRAGLPLTSNITGFVGARYLQFDTRPGERKLDQQVHIGIRWSSK